MGQGVSLTQQFLVDEPGSQPDTAVQYIASAIVRVIHLTHTCIFLEELIAALYTLKGPYRGSGPALP